MNSKIITCLAMIPAMALAQDPPSGQKTLAATMDVYAFPKEGQASEQQSKDEASCYDWAVGNTGNDPFALAKKSEEQQKQAEAEQKEIQESGRGAGARGALRGAAAGAVVGEVVDDDAGDGAAVGAAVGAVAARRRARAGRQQAQQQAEQKSEQQQRATAEELEGFKKAFSVCLEAKDYMVKY